MVTVPATGNEVGGRAIPISSFTSAHSGNYLPYSAKYDLYIPNGGGPAVIRADIRTYNQLSNANIPYKVFRIDTPEDIDLFK